MRISDSLALLALCCRTVLAMPTDPIIRGPSDLESTEGSTATDLSRDGASANLTATGEELNGHLVRREKFEGGEINLNQVDWGVQRFHKKDDTSHWLAWSEGIDEWGYRANPCLGGLASNMGWQNKDLCAEERPYLDNWMVKFEGCNIDADAPWNVLPERALLWKKDNPLYKAKLENCDFTRSRMGMKNPPKQRVVWECGKRHNIIQWGLCQQ